MTTTNDGIFGRGPATDDYFLLGTPCTVDGKHMHAHLAGDAEDNWLVGIELAIDSDNEEFEYLYLDADSAEWLVKELLAAVAKARNRSLED